MRRAALGIFGRGGRVSIGDCDVFLTPGPHRRQLLPLSLSMRSQLCVETKLFSTPQLTDLHRETRLTTFDKSVMIFFVPVDPTWNRPKHEEERCKDKDVSHALSQTDFISKKVFQKSFL